MIVIDPLAGNRRRWCIRVSILSKNKATHATSAIFDHRTSLHLDISPRVHRGLSHPRQMALGRE